MRILAPRPRPFLFNQLSKNDVRFRQGPPARTWKARQPESDQAMFRVHKGSQRSTLAAPSVTLARPLSLTSFTPHIALCSSFFALSPSDNAPSPWRALGAFIGLPLALWAYKVNYNTIVVTVTQ